MFFREWYSYHFPELIKVVPDNYTYARCAHLIKNRNSLGEHSLEELEKITMDSAKAQAILDAARMSMGTCIIWMHPSLSELTPMLFNMGLTHLGSEAFIYRLDYIDSKSFFR